jgi:hypothetical protein
MPKVVEVLESEGCKHNAQAGTITERFCKYNQRELRIHCHITFLGSKE